MQSESIKMLANALCKVQGALESAKKTSDNPYFHSKYADLAEVISVAKELLKDNGLSVVQGIVVLDGHDYLRTDLLHSSGEWLSRYYPIRPVKPDPQTLAATVTYARRAAYQSLLCISAEDDDGNKASQPDKPTPETPKKAATVPKKGKDANAVKKEIAKNIETAWQEYRLKHGNPWLHPLEGKSEYVGKRLAALPDDMIEKFKKEGMVDFLVDKDKLTKTDRTAINWALEHPDLQQQAIQDLFKAEQARMEDEEQPNIFG